MKNNIWFLFLLIIVSCSKIESSKSTVEISSEKNVSEENGSSSGNLIEELVANQLRTKQDTSLNLSTTKSIYIVDIEYLGEVKPILGGKLKLMNIIHRTGILKDALKARGTLAFYNEKNKELGYFEIGSIDQMPSYIELNKNVYFKSTDQCKENNVIDFSDGIPRELFLKCNGSSGNLFSFRESS